MADDNQDEESRAERAERAREALRKQAEKLRAAGERTPGLGFSPPRGPTPSAPPSRDLSWQKHVYSQPEEPLKPPTGSAAVPRPGKPSFDPPRPSDIAAGDPEKRPLDTETVLNNAELSRYGYRTSGERPSENTSVTDQDAPASLEIEAIAKRFSGDALVVLIFGTGIGVSLCGAGAFALLDRRWTPAIVGFGLGLSAMAGAYTFPIWKKRVANWIRQSIVHFAAAGIFVGFIAGSVYVLGPYVLPHYPSADEIATAVAEKFKSSLPSAQPQSFGFAPVQIKIPSKNYSNEEKQKLLGLIGTISTLLNDKGLPAVQIARSTGYNAVGPSKDVLDDAMKRAVSVRDTLAEIQRTIYNDILQPRNSNVLADLKYITENNAKLDQFQRATDGFSNNVENFKRNFDSLSQDQRNWITSLIQAGVGQVWAHSAEDFEGWIQQCNSRMDAEREGLK